MLYPVPNEEFEGTHICTLLSESPSSRVYKVWNPLLGVNRVVKLLTHDCSISARERFLDEIKILAQMSHENLPRIHRAGSWNELDYYETDYVEGTPLGEYLKDNGPFSVETGVALALELAKTLEYVHTECFTFKRKTFVGILHRDIKPSNILLSPKTGATLLDFGISSYSRNGLFPAKVEGKVVGSMPYLAPEILTSDKATFRSDIYSLGTVFYELFTGKRAFPDGDMPRLIHRRMNNLYDPLTRKDGKFPKDLLQLIVSMMDEKEDNRPYSARQVRRELEKIFRKISKESSRTTLTSALMHGEVVQQPLVSTLFGTLSRVAMG